MTVVGNLLAAQDRRDAERVTEAIAEQLQTLTVDNAADTVTAAAAAYRQATTRRVQRPAAARHGVVGFGDPPPDPLAGIEDFVPSREPGRWSDPRYLIGSLVTDTTTADAVDTSPAAVPWKVPENAENLKVAMTTSPRLGDTPAAGAFTSAMTQRDDLDAYRDPMADNAAHDPIYDDAPPAPAETGRGATQDAAEQGVPDRGDAPPAGPPAEEPATPTHVDIPSVADVYGDGPWSADAELDPFRTPRSPVDGPPPAAGAAASAVGPSPRATRPPDHIELPEPDPEPSLSQRIRGSLNEKLDRLRDRRPRAKWLAAGVVGAVLLGGAGVISLSGNRGKPPEPAGVTVAAPSQTENAEPGPATMTLVPATSSASCGDDSDTVAPFTGEKSRAWVCRRANGLDGAVFNITFAKPVVVTAITIVPGFNFVGPDGRDEWGRHRLITGVSWRLGGKVFPQTINPTRTGATMNFPAVLTQEMSMTITSSVRPPRAAENSAGIGASTSAAPDVDETTAVSSITITGYPADGGTGGLK